MNITSVPSIAIILPTYNGATYLRDCLQSVHAQTWTDYELLIGDDASTDDTVNIIQTFSDARWRFIRSERNQGLFANLNQLIRQARAPLIHILCQDDALEPDCLANEAQFFVEHPEIAMSFCKFRAVDEAGVEFKRAPINDLPTVLHPAVALQYYYYYGCLPGNLSTVCVRTSSFEQAGVFDESFTVAGDFDLWVRICGQAPLGVLHHYLIQLRHHPRQLSRATPSGVAHVLETRRIRARTLPLLPPEIRQAAAHYVLRRQNVWDTHYALRCLQAGRRADFTRLVHALGAHDFSFGLLYWMLSVNTRYFRPVPRFVGAP